MQRPGIQVCKGDADHQHNLQNRTKPATVLLGLIGQKPLNAYEIIKVLHNMDVKWWFAIGDSTVYSTLKSLEKKKLVTGAVEKAGNMPERTVYSLTPKGEWELQDTLRNSILQFDYDTNIFSIAAFFLDAFPPKERHRLLQERLALLQKYHAGITKQAGLLQGKGIPALHVANVERMADLVEAEITGTNRLLEACKTGP